MRRCPLQRFLFAALACAVLADSSTGAAVSAVEFTDVDHNLISTADGRTTTMVFTTSTELDKARLVGDRVPDLCLGNPAYRFVTVLTFAGSHSAPTRAFLSSIARHRLDGEAKRLQARYTEKKISQDPRRDVCAVLDFDGAVSQKLGVTPSTFEVLILGPKGDLLHRWSDIPSAEELAKVLKSGER